MLVIGREKLKTMKVLRASIDFDLSTYQVKHLRAGEEVEVTEISGMKLFNAECADLVEPFVPPAEYEETE